MVSKFPTSSSLSVVCCVSLSSLCSWGCEEEFVRAWCPRGEEQRWGGGGVGLQRWYYYYYFFFFFYFYFYPRGAALVFYIVSSPNLYLVLFSHCYSYWSKMCLLASFESRLRAVCAPTLVTFFSVCSCVDDTYLLCLV